MATADSSGTAPACAPVSQTTTDTDIKADIGRAGMAQTGRRPDTAGSGG